MADRAVSPVVGLVLLFGVVGITAVAILFVGTGLTETTAQEAQTQQAERSLTKFAETANQLSQAQGSSETFTIEAGDDANAYVNESAGHIELTLVINESDPSEPNRTILDNDMGSYVTETGDGTAFAYQGGGVFRQDTEGEPVLVRAPNLDYTVDPDPTLTLPVTQIRGNDSGTAGDGDLEVVTRRDAFPRQSLPNPIIGDYMDLTIESQYCTAWEGYVVDETSATVREQCDGGTPDQLQIRMDLANGTERSTRTDTDTTNPDVDEPTVTGGTPGIQFFDIDNGTTPGVPPNNGNTMPSSPDPDVPDEPESDGVYGFFSEGPVDLSSAGGAVYGSLGSNDTVNVPNDVTVTEGSTEGVPVEADPYPDVDAMIASGSNWQENLYNTEWTEGPQSLETGNYGYVIDSEPGGRTIYVENTDDLSSNSRPVVFNVSEGDIDVVIDGDLSGAGQTNLIVTGAENTNHSLNIYVGGDMVSNSRLKIGTPDSEADQISGGGNDPGIDTSDVQPDAVSIYGSSDSEVRVSGDISLEGSIYFPEGTGTGSSSFRVLGSMYIGSFDGSGFSPIVYAAGSVGKEIDSDVGPGGIEGTVYNGSMDVTDAGAGVEDVHVELAGTDVSNANDTYTATDGSFAVDDVTPGNYTVTASPPSSSNYNTTTVDDVRIVGNGTTELDVPLQYEPPMPTNGTIEVNVDDESGAPVATEVSIDGPTTRTDDTDAAGTATFQTVPTGAYDVTLDPDDPIYPDAMQVASNSEVVGGDVTYVNVTLEDSPNDPGELTVSVYDNATDTPAEADVTVENLSDGSTVSRMTSASGPSGNVTFQLDPTYDYDVQIAPTDTSYDPDSLSNHGEQVSVAANNESVVEFPVNDGSSSSTDYQVVTSSGSAGEVHYLHVSETVVEVEDD